MNREKILTGKIYHCYNRGVDKRVVFKTSAEYAYFIHLLYELNDEGSRENIHRDLKRAGSNPGSVPRVKKKDDRSRLVDILAFVLMPNHYHLLLRQRMDDGIAKFMQKLGTGYTMYFNERHDRSGALFQGRYKSVHVDNDAQLLYIPHYIHLNPLKLTEGGSTSFRKKSAEFLLEYKWSSYPDYVGGRAFPSVTDRTLILDLFGGMGKYKKDISQFMGTPEKIRMQIDRGLSIDNE